jgi:hypothetical protein
MFLKCYNCLHPIVESKVGCVYQITNVDFNLDIFEQTLNTNELMKELVTKYFLIFRHYKIDPKEIKCPLQWWGKHKAMLPIIVFLVR